MIRETLREILHLITEASQQRFGDRLVGIVQYGSSVDQVKSVSDLDLLFVFVGLEKPMTREFDFLDELAEPFLQKISAEGFQYGISVNPIREMDLKPSNFFFFDLVDRSHVLFDQRGRLKQFLKEVHQVIVQGGFERVQQGSRWYWRASKYANNG